MHPTPSLSLPHVLKYKFLLAPIYLFLKILFNIKTKSVFTIVMINVIITITTVIIITITLNLMASASFSASMMVGALRFPLTMLGITLASTTRKPSNPCTFKNILICLRRLSWL